MLYIKSLEQAVPVFKALGSEIRVRLIQTLLEHQEMNMNELAASLGITNGALTSHVKKLEETGILAILPEHSGHGNQKVCRINVDKILVDVATNNESPAENSYSIDILIIVSEIFTKECQSANILGWLIHLEAEYNIILGGESKLLGVDI